VNGMLFAALVGAWSCSTAGGSAVDSTFSLAPNGDVIEHIAWTNSGAGGTWDQSFSYDPQAETWNVKNVGSNGWIFTGTTAGAIGNTALITGTQSEGSSSVPTRERFTFETPGSFQHTWEQQAADGSWKPTSYADCTLASKAAPTQQKS